ncbi:MAG: chromosome segregation protein SMC [Candidatus Bathyarchaeia archaeon]|jgi:chromosome segregation protein|nr:chromosome segregation protein SMC [Candidatus Bathyarchaeota archaeon A05DMB-4]MDH7595812.1 chromosome segregation protein SMC [Candidatus Bathyarchaeota archaeon]
MPYIKKIELKGFKSFGPETVTITLDKGFTAVTGPNGSGKTNVVDAVLFVLGELSSRRLRAENFSRLIFHGSPEAGVEKANMAKVVIQFDNTDGRIPIETSTVTVSREVFRNGQSVYRVNGRTFPRARVLDLFSMAGLSSTGHNVILQGTITRLTEISSDERRKIIEDLIGIAQYDAEKAQAEQKLRTAEISIRTAMGRIDEVQRRVDDLERERTELLRYNFIQKEIKRLEAMKFSYEINKIKEKTSEVTARLEEINSKLESLRQIREQHRTQRHAIESEWRKLSSEMVEEGGSKVLEVQIKIGDLKSKLTELVTKIGAGTTSFEGLKKVDENNTQQLESIRKEIVENRKRIERLQRQKDRLQKEMDAKQANHDALANETNQLWKDLGEHNARIREIEKQLDNLYRNLMDLRTEHARSQTTIKILTRRLEDLNNRKNRFVTTLGELEKSRTDLEEVQKEQKKQLKSLEHTLERRIAQKDAVIREVDEAGKIAETAREAVVEFATQRELAETVAAEENALRNIEELARIGVITGVYGRLRNLIKTEKTYEQAIEVAAGGWLDALVVKDIETAFTCTETLRQLKLGRIKIIPIKGLVKHRELKLPRTESRGGIASNFVKCTKEHMPAVDFVLGDTIIVDNEKTAMKIAQQGHRTVTINGDLYEPGGALESGYYRAPIDFSTIIPSESAIKRLDEAVSALREHLTRRESAVSSLEEEIDKLRVDITKMSEAIATLDGEIDRIKRSAKITQHNIRRVDNYIKGLQEKLDKEKTQTGLQKAQRQSIRKEIQQLRTELATLRRKTDLSLIQSMEVQREKLADEIIEMRRKLGTIDTEMSTLHSKYENVLKPSYENIKVQLGKVRKQLSIVEKEVNEALQERERLKEELLTLEKSREELSHSVLSARKEAKNFTDQIDSIDKKLRHLDTEYEQTERIYNQLQLSLQTTQLQLEQYWQRLREFGCEKPLVVSPEQLAEAETSLKMMQLELERLGAVNQLALSHYAEQVSRYRELSVRMNELEKEKQAILDFMEEIERKKRTIFTEAFQRINTNIGKYFSKLTGGGEAVLKLEDPEEPFRGGIDMIVTFPNKPPIIVSGASGGERSVAAVAFIFALQEFTPAAFYIFDEIDAHLDAFHVGKLGELLREEAEKTQFIAITLKPEIVNKAQKIYGVYERNGISHVVAANLKEVAA